MTSLDHLMLKTRASVSNFLRQLTQYVSSRGSRPLCEAGVPKSFQPCGPPIKVGPQNLWRGCPSLIRSAIDLLDKTKKRTEYRLSMLNSELTGFFFTLSSLPPETGLFVIVFIPGTTVARNTSQTTRANRAISLEQEEGSYCSYSS